MRKLVSVILPTYNVEDYLDRCLRSIVKQTYSNLEIIVVIDGATDKSYDIALKWGKLDSRIQVIYQENAGSGPARNNGLAHATGELIMFVDPDDWIDANMIETLLTYQEKNNYDLVLSNNRTIDIYGNIVFEEKKEGTIVLENQREVRDNYLKLFGLGYLSAPTKNLYRRKLIKDNGIEFPDLRRSQDIVFNYRYYDKVTKVIAIDDIFYNYFVDEMNYTSKLKNDYYQTLSYIYKEICQYCASWNVDLAGQNYILACNYLFHSIVANLEANHVRKESLYPIYKDNYLKKLINDSAPKRKDEVLIRRFCIHECTIGIAIILELRLLLKKIRFLVKKYDYFLKNQRHLLNCEK